MVSVLSYDRERTWFHMSKWVSGDTVTLKKLSHEKKRGWEDVVFADVEDSKDEVATLPTWGQGDLPRLMENGAVSIPGPNCLQFEETFSNVELQISTLRLKVTFVMKETLQILLPMLSTFFYSNST